MASHNEFGKKGEQLAAAFLLEKDYKILDRNFRYLKAEIDIIALKDNWLVIVEVKSRNTNFIEHVAETVNNKKQKLLITAADAYVVERNLDLEVRFDIITVLKKDNDFDIEHIENAFYHF